MKKIVVSGEILVEIMAETVGEGFDRPLALTGPYPSGAPAIFIDQVARFGHPCAIVSAVGDDDFGRLNLDRLQRDGVDISGVEIDRDRPTGSAFVRYRPDGSRDFVFNIRHSASGHPPTSDAAKRVLSEAEHFHVMGSSLSSPEFIRLNLRTAEEVKARGGSVSFDPNLRKEILDAPGLLEAMTRILALTDLFLPSGDELFLLTESNQTVAADAELLDRGIQAIVQKRGVEGVRYRDAEREIHIPAFTVKEVDPTGAGDCFGGAFTALWLQGGDLKEALTLATAAAAFAVTHRGPMEGVKDLDTLRRFAANRAKVA